MNIFALLVLSTTIFFANISAAPFSTSDVLPWNWSVFEPWWANVATAHVKPPTGSVSGNGADGPIPTPKPIQKPQINNSGPYVLDIPVLGNPITSPVKISISVDPPKEIIDKMVPIPKRAKRAETDLIYEYDGYA